MMKYYNVSQQRFQCIHDKFLQKEKKHLTGRLKEVSTFLHLIIPPIMSLADDSNKSKISVILSERKVKLERSLKRSGTELNFHFSQLESFKIKTF